jgi:hypothetical protein
MTALTLYGTATASSTLSTADQFSTSTGSGTPQVTTAPASGSNYMELLSQGGSGTLYTTPPAPTGHGWLLDSTLLEAQTMPAGSWTASVQLADTAMPTGVSASAAAIVVRYYKRSSAGVYTSVGTLTLSNPTIYPTQTTYTLSGSLSSMAFSSGDKLYADLFLDGGANWWSTDTISVNVSAFQVATPGYSPSGSTNATRSLPIRIKVSTQRIKSLALRTLVRTQNIQSLAVRTLVRTQHIQSLAIRILAFGQNTRSLPIRTLVNTQEAMSLAIRIVVRTISDTYSVNIAGVGDVFVDAGSLTIDNTIGKRSQANFIVKTDNTVHFRQYQQVWIYNKAGMLVFSGYISQPQEKKPGYQPSLVHTLSAIDQHFLADKRLIVASYTNKTAGYIVQDILNNILSQEGVSIGMIYDGPTPSDTLFPSDTLYPGGNVGLIPQASFVYATVAQALDALVTAASSSGVPYYWMIDQHKMLWFVPYTAVVNSTLVDGTQIDEKNNPPSVQRQNSLYRNVQYITGGFASTLPQTETRMGDGNTQSWAMGYQLASTPTITVNGVAKTVGIKGVDTGYNFYWAAGDNVITQDSAGVKLTASDTLQISYVGQYPTVIISQNGAQIAYESAIDGTSGIVESAQNDSTLTSVSNGLSEASQLLTRYATQGTILQFTTLDPSFAPGQLITVDLPDFGLFHAQMLIEEASISDQTDGYNLWNTVKAVQGPYDQTWVDFFSKLLAQPQVANSINLGTNQSVTLLAPFTGTISMSASLSVDVYACPLPGDTLYPSDTLYPC